MNADEAKLIDAGLTARVIGVFYDVYNELGAGFLESVYESALTIALEEVGLAVMQQAPLMVGFRGRPVGEFRVDLLVNERLVVEIKAASRIVPAHEVQLVNYLKATGIPVGLLLNFGPRAEFKRRVFESASKSAPIRVNPRQNNVQ